MPKRCCITNCYTGTVYCRKVVSIFSTPKEDSSFLKWQEAVGRTGVILKKHHFVCEKHFPKNEIKSENVIEDADGNVIFQRTLRKKYLLKGSIPSIFTKKNISASLESESIRNVTNTTKSTKSILSGGVASQRKMHLTSNINTLSICSSSFNIIDAAMRTEETEGSLNGNITEVVDPLGELNLSLENEKEETANDKDVLHDEEKTKMGNRYASVVANDGFFGSIVDGTCRPQLPSLSWGFCVQEFFEKKTIVFQEVGKDISNSGGQAPWYKKQITVDDSSNVKVYIHDRLLSEENRCIDVCSLKDLENIVEHVDRMKICQGGPLVKIYRLINPKCAYKDSSARWRHNLCTLEVENGLICKECATLENTLRKHYLHRNKKVKVHSSLSSSRKEKLEILRYAARIHAKSLNRSRRTLFSVTTEIEELKKKLSRVEQATLED